MGNTECQDCISAEREMFAEIILGREFASKKYLSNTKINVKKISDKIPHEHIDNNKDKILIAKNQNQLLQKANQVINKKDGINKESDTNISNKSTKNKEEHNKQSIENDNAIIKIMFLALKNASCKWTMPIRNWGMALNQFAIVFGDRVPL